MNLLRIASRVASYRYATGSRYLVIDLPNKVAYPYTDSAAADAKVTELVASLDQGNKDYLNDVLQGQPPTADGLLDAEVEADVMVFVEDGQSTAICFSSSDRSSFAVAWPPVGVDFLGNGDPLIFHSGGVGDGQAVRGVDTSQQEDPDYTKWIAEHDGGGEQSQ